MPFKKVGTDDYVSPSGRHFDTAQVRLWHANGNKFPGQKAAEYANGGPVMANKGYLGKTEKFAKGGPVLGKESSFMKSAPEAFRSEGAPNPSYAGGKPKGKDKSETPIKPR